jgi:hypothetical protein
MEDTEILNVTVRANPDIVQVSPNNAVKPDIGSWSYLDITNDRSIFSDESRWIDLRISSLEFQDHFLTPFIPQKDQQEEQTLRLSL